MASPFGKFFAPITVPTGGWTLDWVASSGTSIITITAGDYADILALATQLQTQLRALGAGPPDHTADAVQISRLGIVSIYIVAMTGQAWATTDAAFSEAFGFAETEAVASNYLVGTIPHAYGWYPGAISFGVGDGYGAGIAADTGWIVADETLVTTAGSGASRIIAPARRRYTRTVRFGPLKKSEALDARNRGPAALMDRWSTGVLRWYLDRDSADGASATVGTQMDPGAPEYDIDTDHDYYKVTLIETPTITPIASNPDWFDVTLKLNAEPK